MPTNLLVDFDWARREGNAFAETLHSPGDGAVQRDLHILAVHGVEAERRQIVGGYAATGTRTCNKSPAKLKHHSFFVHGVLSLVAERALYHLSPGKNKSAQFPTHESE
jgi:hypothetical protein